MFDEIDLRRALNEEEFCPFFQPLVELRTGQLAGFELLARWKHPRLGIILPDDFIPMVERCGLIDELTRQILKKAFTAAPLIPPPLDLSVNLSPDQLLDFTLPARIEAVAEQGSFSLDRLTIEITESALLADLPRAQSVARELKALHCRLWLDDFGIGYSSLKHLQSLPFDGLKVDKSFVSSMTRSRESRKIVAAVVGLGCSLGLITVAEGTETKEQASMLLWLGCVFGQGYLYSKPVPAEDLPPIISRMPQVYSICLSMPADADPITNLEALPGQRFAQLQAIYDGAPVGLALLDRQLCYVSINRRLAQMNGAPVAAHLGRSVTELVPDLYPQFSAFLFRALKGESITNVEVQRPIPGEKGCLRTLMLSYQPVRDEAGEVMGISTAVVDISERKCAEQALHESEEHYRNMIELNPHTPWIMDTDGKTIEVSSRWQKMTGFTKKQTLGRGWLKALHPDDVERVKENLGKALASGKPMDVQYRIRFRSGEWRWVRSRGFPRFAPSGKAICWYGSLEDIQEQKQVEVILQRTLAELQAIVDVVPLGIVIAHAQEGVVALANPEAERIFHDAILPGQAIAGYDQWGALHTDGKPLEPDEYPLASAILRGETTEAEEVLCPREDGTQVRVTLSAKPICDPDGQVVGGFMIVRDGSAEIRKR